MIFDAEPILAFGLDEPNADVVESHLNRVFNNVENGYISFLNLAEVRYVIIREDSIAKADTYLHYLTQKGLERIWANDVWRQAAAVKAQYSVPIADAFAASSAEYLDETLLIGDDEHFDDIADDGLIDIQRFND